MKRVHSSDAMKSAYGSVKQKLTDIGQALNPEDAKALSGMLDLADKHAKQLSEDELKYVNAGDAAKPQSSCR